MFVKNPWGKEVPAEKLLRRLEGEARSLEAALSSPQGLDEKKFFEGLSRLIHLEGNLIPDLRKEVGK